MIHTCGVHCRRAEQTRRVGGDKSLFENITGQKRCDNRVNAALYRKANGTRHFSPLAAELPFDNDTWCPKALLTKIRHRL